MRYIALLRGINVGGKNKLLMADLRQLAADCGGLDVQSYIQSGNLVLTMTSKAAQSFPAQLAQEIKQAHALTIPVVLRSQKQLAAALKRHPFADEIKNEADEKLLHLGFLAQKPSAKLIKNLDPQRGAPDRFVVLGSEIFFYVPGGLARTKLSNAYFDRVLETTSTMRNWRTAHKLLALCVEAERL